MLPVVDPDGVRTAYTGLEPYPGIIAGESLSVFVRAGRTGLFGGGIDAGRDVCVERGRFSRQISEAGARRLFHASIIYLPLLLALMVFNKQ